jgi:isopropylmalate/homocitrate/citramalate synthase
VNDDRFSRELEFLHDGKLWRPTVNRHPGVTAGNHAPDGVIICDETLREGEETPGVRLTRRSRLDIATKLEAAGIPELEVGYVGAIEEHAAFSRELKALGTTCRLVSHTRTYTQASEWKKEIDLAVDAGSDILCLLSHGSETLAASMPWLPLEQVPERVAEAIAYTRELGVTPALTLVDGIRTPLDNFLNIYRAAAAAGVERVYVMDGQGVALPETAYFLVRMLRGIVGPDVEIAVHFHDDYGLATANSLAGVRAGATVVDTVVGGFGDKAGIAATEEIVMALEVLYGVGTGVDITMLADLADVVVRAFDTRLAPNKAVVGENIVRHQIDSHLNTLIRGYWWAWEAIDPALFGRERSLEWAEGKLRSGRSGSVMAKVEQLQLTVTDAQWEQLLSDLRDRASDQAFVSEPELEAIIRSVVAGGSRS